MSGKDSVEDESERRLISGWQGRFHEDFTETDDVWLINLTMNLEPMHFNEAHAAETEFGERLVNGFVVVAAAVEMSVIGAQPGGSS